MSEHFLDELWETARRRWAKEEDGRRDLQRRRHDNMESSSV